MTRGRRMVRGRALVVGVLLVAASLVGTGPAAADGPTASDGFHVDVVDAGFGDFQLTDLAHLDEGHVLATGKSGAVRFVSLDGSGSREVGRLADVEDAGDLGLVSIALADDYATTGHVFLSSNHRDAQGAYGRLSRWTVDDPAAPTSLGGRQVVLDRIRTDADIHSVGEIVVRSDGTLYLGVGDGRPNAGGAQPETLRTFDPDQPQGKVLRITPDGQGVPGNPYWDAGAPSSWASRTYVIGLRNPFRYTTLPGDEDVLVIGNVARNGDEGLFVGTAGDNFGWPCREGAEPTPGYADLDACQDLEAQQPSPFTPPVWGYGRDLPPGGGVSITGGAFPTSTTYPVGFRGDYVFGDYARRVLWSAQLSPAGALTRVPEAGPDGEGTGTFASGLGAPVAFAVSPSGLLRWADILRGEVVTLRWSAGNRPPTARVAADLDTTTRVRFRTDGSYDLDGDDLTWTWDFGDGRTGTGPSPAHTYDTAGRYVATATVDDGRGGTDTATVEVPLDDDAPTFTRFETPGATTFAIGDTIALAATVDDTEDGDLSGAVSWLAQLEHCPPGGDCHLHGADAGGGAAFAMAFPDHGDDTRVLVTATVEDSAGRVAMRTYRAEPRLVRVTGASDPAGLDVRVNGFTGPQVVTVRSLNSARAPAVAGPVRFAGWSDGATMEERPLVAPEQDTVLTARWEADVARAAGVDRVGTAVAVSRATVAAADTVVLARFDDPADALAAAPLAGALGAPVLLTPTAALDERVAAELDRLGTAEVVLVGGTAALSEDVADAVAARGPTVARVAGPDRWATAVAVADRLGVDRAVVVRGDTAADGTASWADALAAGPAAARSDRAVLLVGRDTLPDVVAGWLAGTGDVVVAGGTAAVSADVLAAVEAVGPTVTRVGGVDRYETARLLDALASTEAPARVWLTTGRDWPDALAAGAAAAGTGGRLLLAGTDVVATTGLASAASLAEVADVRLAGGERALPAAVEAALVAAVRAAIPSLAR